MELFKIYKPSHVSEICCNNYYWIIVVGELDLKIMNSFIKVT